MANITGNLPGENALVGTLSTKGSLVGGLGVVYGKDGKSAYEIAVKNGFEGTEEEWLASLQGKNGVDGKDGKDGTVSFDELTEAQRESLRGEQGEQGPQGERGAPGVVKYIVVTELPEEDTETAIYLVPSATGTADNMYDEYIYTDGVWEQIGSTAVEVDLTDYVKKTDYATKDKAGVAIVRESKHGLMMNADGTLRIYQASIAEIDAKTDNYKPITSARLDYAVKKAMADNKQEWTEEEKTSARTLLGAVGTADYPKPYESAGVVNVNPTAYGIGSYPATGYLYITPAGEAEIDGKAHDRRPIVPSNLDYAVKKALVDCKNTTWTEEEKAAARALLGITDSNTAYVASAAPTNDVGNDGDLWIVTE